jgi:predicted RNase H-like HicB family nuclease
MPERVAFAVLTYRQGETWYAEIPDLRAGTTADTEAEALALAQVFIAEVRDSYRQQGVAPLAPQTRCHMVDVD